MFCNSCGATLHSDQRFCASCGKQVVAAPPPPASLPPLAVGSRLARHLRMLGIFWIAFSALRVLKGGGHILGAGVVRRMGHGWFGPLGWGWPAGDILPSILSFTAMCLLALAVAGLAAGWGLMERRSWARTLAVILGILALFDPLLGTALGIYTLWVLLPAQAEQEYRRIAT